MEGGAGTSEEPALSPAVEGLVGARSGFTSNSKRHKPAAGRRRGSVEDVSHEKSGSALPAEVTKV